MVQNALDYDRETCPVYRMQKLSEILAESYDKADPAASLTDLLADARHFADAHGLNIADCDRVAHNHYLQERGAL